VSERRFDLVRLRKGCKNEQGKPFTQQDAATLFGCSVSYIQKLEAGTIEGGEMYPNYVRDMTAYRKAQTKGER
jgi:predicted transcriptional regulator